MGAYKRMKTSTNEITDLLLAWRGGNKEALDKLMPLVYSELRGLAHRYVRREGPGQTLQTTSLVHEAYLRLVGRDEVAWQNRAHFFAVCADVMRSLLIDRARARQISFVLQETQLFRAPVWQNIAYGKPKRDS